MKNKMITIVFFLIANYIAAQEKIVNNKIKSNEGIIVYTSSGVEGLTNQSTEISNKINVQVPISEYTQIQCENAISDISLKINAVVGEIDAQQQIEKYKQQIILLENRILEINNESHGKN